MTKLKKKLIQKINYKKRYVHFFASIKLKSIPTTTSIAESWPTNETSGLHSPLLNIAAIGTGPCAPFAVATCDPSGDQLQNKK